MTHCHHDSGRGRRDWDDVGRAAEEFARHIARDAGQFGERIAAHAGEFARRMSREFRQARQQGADWDGDDVRAVLNGVRTILTDVIDGVDELIDRVFGSGGREDRTPADEWVRVVANREMSCGACGRGIGSGEDCHLRRHAGGREFRCVECGVPKPSNDQSPS
jgi:hypothetical protein